jgi:selenophosphate synthetase-related protein
VAVPSTTGADDPVGVGELDEDLDKDEDVAIVEMEEEVVVLEADGMIATLILPT